MGRGRRVDGRSNAMPPDRFEVDLTSVCVRRGAVQLPFRLKDAFTEGSVAAVDADGGAALELAFHAPRELAGLGAFFQAHALRANDAVGLVFTPRGLQLQAIRRERGSRRTGSEREPTPSSVTDRATPEPRATASPGGAPGASEPASSPTTDVGSTPRSAASKTPPSLRMEVPRASEPAEQGEGSTRADRVRSSAPRWEPLDVTSAAVERDASDASSASRELGRGDPNRVIVREVRRSRTSAEVADPETGAEEAPEGPVRAPQTESGRASTATGPGTVAPSNERHGRAALLLGLARRLGRTRGPDRGGVRRAGGPEQDDAELSSHAGSNVAHDGRARAGDVRRESGGSQGGPAAGTLGTGATSSAATGLDQSGNGGATAGAGASAPAGQDETVSVVQGEAWELEAVRSDMAEVDTYLAGPDVPAIVRTERVAEALGISMRRAERALERVSEDSEELSRIRGGAYMLRRPSKG